MNIFDNKYLQKLVDDVSIFYGFYFFIGVVVLLIGATLLFFGFTDLDEQQILTISIGLMALGLGCLSVKKAKESDKRMITLAEETFLAIKGILEDRRLSLLNKKIQYEHCLGLDNHSELIECQLLRIDYINTLSFSIWKCYTDLTRIDLFKDYMKKNEHLEDKQNSIIKYLKLYYEELINGRDILKMKISPEYKKHIRWMFEIVEKFEIFSKSEYRGKLIKYKNELQRDKQY